MTVEGHATDMTVNATTPCPHHMASGNSMSMAFHFGTKETILFDFWKTSSLATLVGSIVGVFLLAVFYEGFKAMRQNLLRRKHVSNGAVVEGMIPQMLSDEVATKLAYKPRYISWSHILQTFLQMLQVLVSYFLMLIFMTYNVWLCLAVVVGSGVGYFLFSLEQPASSAQLEVCH